MADFHPDMCRYFTGQLLVVITVTWKDEKVPVSLSVFVQARTITGS